MRYAEVMKDTETAMPGAETVLFVTAGEATIIGEALAEYAERHGRKRTARAMSVWFDRNIVTG